MQVEPAGARPAYTGRELPAKNAAMPPAAGKQLVIVRVAKPADEADFFARLFGSAAMVAGETARMVDTGRFVLRIEHAPTPAEQTRNLNIDVSVDNVNKFAEDVWNRGIKYASRPQNHTDGFRRVGFVSPGDIRVFGVGPQKMDSTGALPSWRDRPQ
jgi:hypothetical protein